MPRLARAYPRVHWVGTVPHADLVDYYNAADAFVYPSRTDTFGLVMLEALACGTPVAAYPVEGPLDVVGTSDGGVLDLDLGRAAVRALAVPRHRARGPSARLRCRPYRARVRRTSRADRRRGACRDPYLT
jgi:glycosyltransferase involved in cell wall biosynthesis